LKDEPAEIPFNIDHQTSNFNRAHSLVSLDQQTVFNFDDMDFSLFEQEETPYVTEALTKSLKFSGEFDLNNFDLASIDINSLLQ